MSLREILLASLLDRFRDQGMRVGTPSDRVTPAAYGDLIARFPAMHPEVGDARVLAGGNDPRDRNPTVLFAAVSVGEIIVQYSFNNFDTHLGTDARAVRVTNDVVRFLQELFADRVLLWRSTDDRSAGWRERGDAGHSEPLVLDDRTYRRCVWSGPLSLWRATPLILARGRIRDDREYQIVLQRLNDAGPDGFQVTERDLASRLVADYEQRSATDG